MTLKKSYLSFILLITSTTLLFAQRKVDIGVTVGGTYYYGDVVNEFTPATARYSAGAFLRYHLSDRFAIRANGLFARISGDDKLSKGSEWQRRRNWSFITDIFEASSVLEFNLIEDRNSGRKLRNPLIPYIYVGLGAFYYKPQTELPNGELVGVRSSQLSGVAYNEVDFCIPIGVGFRYYAFRNYMIGFDLGIRYTSTSYLDDIGGFDTYQDPNNTPYPTATRSIYSKSLVPRNPGDLRGKMGTSALNVNDIYVIGSLTIAYRLGKPLGSKGRRFGKAISCPRFY
jgi:hypothetical protein